MKLSVWLSYIAGMSGKVFNTMMSLKFAIIQSDVEAVVSDRRRFPFLPNLVFDLIIPYVSLVLCKWILQPHVFKMFLIVTTFINLQLEECLSKL